MKTAEDYSDEGVQLYESGRIQDALKAFEDAIALDENFVAAWIGKGYALSALGSYEKVVSAYEHAIALGGNYAFAWNGKGNALNELNRHKEALAACEHAIALDENFAFAWNGKGNALRNIGRYEESLAAYERAIALDENYAFAWNGKGNALRNIGRYEEAIAAYDTAIALDENLVPPWIGKTHVYEKLENVRRAHPCLMRGCRLMDERFFFQYSKLVILLIEKFASPLFIYRVSREYPGLITSVHWGEISKTALSQYGAVLHFLNFVERYSGFSSSLEKLKFKGLLYYYLGDPLEAENIFDQVDDEDETDLMGQYYLVMSLLASCTYGEAKTAFGFALQHAKELAAAADPETDAAQWYYAGHIFRLNGNYTAALDAFVRAWHTDGEFLAALYMQMFCCHKLKQTEERDRLVDEILQKENMLKEQGKSGFCGQIMPERMTLDGWQKAVGKYVQWMEISDALRLLSGLSENLSLPESYIFRRYAVES